jgi:hypothetical protein
VCPPTVRTSRILPVYADSSGIVPELPSRHNRTTREILQSATGKHSPRVLQSTPLPPTVEQGVSILAILPPAP